MLAVHSKACSGDLWLQGRAIVPGIGLIRPVAKPPQRGEYAVLKCRTDPSNATSPMFDFHATIFKDGTPEEWLNFVNILKKGFAGQGIGDGPGKYEATRRLMAGSALKKKKKAATNMGNETSLHHEDVLAAVARYIFPAKSLQNQKRYSY